MFDMLLRRGALALGWVAFAGTTAIAGPGPVPGVVELRIADAWVREGDTGTDTLRFVVALSVPSDDAVFVDWGTADATATAGNADYLPSSGSLFFPIGATRETVSVAVVGDLVLEGNEIIQVTLSNPEGATIADGEAFGTIANDERTSFVRIHPDLPPYGNLDRTLSPAWSDIDRNGWSDLPLYQCYPGPVFLEALGFRDLLANGNYHGSAWCDYDRDGFPDLVILPYEGIEDDKVDGEIEQAIGTGTETLLLHNQGDGTFVNVAPGRGMDVQGFGETAVWADFDADGWPDLFTPYYSHVWPFRSFLYHNDGDGTFTERAVEAGVDLPGLPPWLRPEGACAADWNGDGAIDLYCASHLFLNDGHGDFQDVRETVGLPIVFDEGTEFVDFDNDGDLDLYLRAEESPRLFRNDGGTFHDATEAAGLGPVPLLWGDSWADVDNDGDLDLLLMPGGSPVQLWLNRGDGVLERDVGFEDTEITEQLSAWADMDGDGDLDLVIGAYTKDFFLNQMEGVPRDGENYLRVRVLDDRGAQTGQGVSVRLTRLDGGPGAVQTRIVDGGSGYLTQNEYAVQFGGLGEGRYCLAVAFPGAAGAPVVVDSLSSPLLGPFKSTGLPAREINVYRDGRAEYAMPRVAAVADRSGRTNRLGPPSPVPARASVVLTIGADMSGWAELSIYDLHGRRVRRLDVGALHGAGGPPVRWDLADERGTRVADGVYFCRLSVDARPAGQRRVVVVR